MATAVATTTADRMVSLGSSLGQVWNRHRRQLPPDVRKCFVELMASVGTYVEVDHIDEARSDAKECVELKKLLDLKGSSCTTTTCTGLATMTDVSVQTDSNLCNTVAVTGEASLVDVVSECAFLQVLTDLNCFKASWEESLASFDFSVAGLASTAGEGGIRSSIDIEETSFEDNDGLMAEMNGRLEVFSGLVSQYLLYIVGIQVALIRQFRMMSDDMNQEVAFGCVGSGLLSSEFGKHDELDVGFCDPNVLLDFRGRVGGLLGQMSVAATSFLPAQQSVLLGHSGDCKTVFLELSPEWTCVPSSIVQRALAIRSSPPEHLVGLDFCDMDHYGVVLNEIPARPNFLVEYISILREVQGVCGDRVDLVCEVLGISLDWVALKRAIVARVLGREVSFALLDVMGEIRNSML